MRNPSGEATIEALRASGRYEIRVYHHDEDVVAVSAPFEVLSAQGRS
jgi:hypothetical protein